MGLLSGSTLISRVQRMIVQQSVAWSEWTGRALNDIGVYEPTYNAPVNIVASVQPIPREKYETLGLDFQKSYVTIYTQADLTDLQRDGSCDLIDYAGRRYNVLNNTDWINQFGWKGSVCVDVGATP